MIQKNSILDEKNRQKADFVRDTINSAIAHHFPAATPSHITEVPDTVGLDATPIDGKHSMRAFLPVAGDEDMWPGFIHASHNMPAAELKKDQDRATDGLRRDLNRLLTGNPDGEKLPIVAAKDADGKVTSRTEIDRVRVSLSTQYPQGALTVIAQGTETELFDRIKGNLAKDENADLRTHAPKTSRTNAV